MLVVDDSVINRKVITKILHHIADNSKNNYLSSRRIDTNNVNNNNNIISSNSSLSLNELVASTSSISSLSIIEKQQLQCPICFEVTEADDGITALAEITSNLQSSNSSSSIYQQCHIDIDDIDNYDDTLVTSIINNESNTNSSSSSTNSSNSIKKLPYFAILIDNIMVQMHGPEATKRIRALGYKGIIIAITGIYTDSSNRYHINSIYIYVIIINV